ncbi:hypothetical protein ABT369_24830 [Dactylosporangium sp. NPDC000244]|uniref:hypothetical protein n=1 Tax=Dactylosporangium sp. NPDC000244 TaxID=3154365 RepID=UPI00331B9FCB
MVDLPDWWCLASTRRCSAFDLVAPGFDLVVLGVDLVAPDFDLAVPGADLVAPGFDASDCTEV